MTEYDIQFVKSVAHLVNVIPVIAKSDAMTEEEVEQSKSSHPRGHPTLWSISL